jgi:hypothetical protein
VPSASCPGLDQICLLREGRAGDPHLTCLAMCVVSGHALTQAAHQDTHTHTHTHTEERTTVPCYSTCLLLFSTTLLLQPNHSSPFADTTPTSDEAPSSPGTPSGLYSPWSYFLSAPSLTRINRPKRKLPVFPGKVRRSQPTSPEDFRPLPHH